MNTNDVLGIVLAALIAALFASVIPRKLKEREKFADAVANFRGKILSELSGIYPVHGWWNESDFPIFQRSIKGIDTAAAEFGYFVKRKTEFESAIKNYCEYCQRRTYEKGVPRMTYKDIPEPGIDPVKEFESIVKHILSFAN